MFKNHLVWFSWFEKGSLRWLEWLLSTGKPNIDYKMI